jgi:hypothetical protein
MKYGYWFYCFRGIKPRVEIVILDLIFEVVNMAVRGFE